MAGNNIPSRVYGRPILSKRSTTERQFNFVLPSHLANVRKNQTTRKVTSAEVWSKLRSSSASRNVSDSERSGLVTSVESSPVKSGKASQTLRASKNASNAQKSRLDSPESSPAKSGKISRITRGSVINSSAVTEPVADVTINNLMSDDLADSTESSGVRTRSMVNSLSKHESFSNTILAERQNLMSTRASNSNESFTSGGKRKRNPTDSPIDLNTEDTSGTPEKKKRNLSQKSFVSRDLSVKASERAESIAESNSSNNANLKIYPDENQRSLRSTAKSFISDVSVSKCTPEKKKQNLAPEKSVVSSESPGKAGRKSRAESISSSNTVPKLSGKTSEGNLRSNRSTVSDAPARVTRGMIAQAAESPQRRGMKSLSEGTSRNLKRHKTTDDSFLPIGNDQTEENDSSGRLLSNNIVSTHSLEEDKPYLKSSKLAGFAESLRSNEQKANDSTRNGAPLQQTTTPSFVTNKKEGPIRNLFDKYSSPSLQDMGHLPRDSQKLHQPRLSSGHALNRTSQGPKEAPKFSVEVVKHSFITSEKEIPHDVDDHGSFSGSDVFSQTFPHDMQSSDIDSENASVASAGGMSVSQVDGCRSSQESAQSSYIRLISPFSKPLSHSRANSDAGESSLLKKNVKSRGVSFASMGNSGDLSRSGRKRKLQPESPIRITDSKNEEIIQKLKQRKPFPLSAKSIEFLNSLKVPKLEFEIRNIPVPNNPFKVPMRKPNKRPRLAERTGVALKEVLLYHSNSPSRSHPLTQITALEVGLTVIVQTFESIRSKVQGQRQLNFLRKYEDGVIQEVRRKIEKLVDFKHKLSGIRKLTKDVKVGSERLGVITDHNMNNDIFS